MYHFLSHWCSVTPSQRHDRRIKYTGINKCSTKLTYMKGIYPQNQSHQLRSATARPRRTAGCRIIDIPHASPAQCEPVMFCLLKSFLRRNDTFGIIKNQGRVLRECCQSQISWTGNQIHLPRRWNVPGGTIRRNALFQYRYFLNYCTFSYTMAFWDFPRWQRELDWMALNGINLALASVIGQECVWRNVMRRMGQTEPEIRQFIAGPAFEPWWLMDNLEACFSVGNYGFDIRATGLPVTPRRRSTGLIGRKNGHTSNRNSRMRPPEIQLLKPDELKKNIHRCSRKRGIGGNA